MLLVCHDEPADARLVDVLGSNLAKGLRRRNMTPRERMGLGGEGGGKRRKASTRPGLGSLQLGAHNHLPLVKPPKRTSPTTAMMRPHHKLQTMIRTIPEIARMPPTPTLRALATPTPSRPPPCAAVSRLATGVSRKQTVLRATCSKCHRYMVGFRNSWPRADVTTRLFCR
jgi:hypothetical protein